jgi:hypothetical protein
MLATLVGAGEAIFGSDEAIIGGIFTAGTDANVFTITLVGLLAFSSMGISLLTTNFGIVSEGPAFVLARGASVKAVSTDFESAVESLTNRIPTDFRTGVVSSCAACDASFGCFASDAPSVEKLLVTRAAVDRNSN